MNKPSNTHYADAATELCAAKDRIKYLEAYIQGQNDSFAALMAWKNKLEAELTSTRAEQNRYWDAESAAKRMDELEAENAKLKAERELLLWQKPVSQDYVCGGNVMREPPPGREIYVGTIIVPNGAGHHIILLPGDHEDADCNDSVQWATSIGGDLPDRVEQALLYKHLPEQFQKAIYWSNTQHAANSDDAWCQYFGDGSQYWFNKNDRFRARAVRRIAIGQ